jgi:hypothetical protein
MDKLRGMEDYDCDHAPSNDDEASQLLVYDGYAV